MLLVKDLRVGDLLEVLSVEESTWIEERPSAIHAQLLIKMARKSLSVDTIVLSFKEWPWWIRSTVACPGDVCVVTCITLNEIHLLFNRFISAFIEPRSVKIIDCW